MVYEEPRSSRGRRRLPLVLAAVIGVILVLVVRALVTGGSGSSGGSAAHSTSGASQPNRANCVQLNVSASSEKAALLSDLAASYNQAGHSVNGSCVAVTVTSNASGAAAEALAGTWDVQANGPRPDVWTPASSSWAVLLRQRTTAQDKADLVPDSTPSIVQTPLVIAMPKPMAQVLGWPKKQLGWGDLLALSKDKRGWGAYGHAEWGAFRLGKTNPNLSTSGLNATIAAYFAATGLSSDLTVKDVASTKAADYVRQLESSVVHYGDTTLTFMENLYAAAQAGEGLTYISAVTVEEKSVWDYNQGNPSGDPKTAGQRSKPKVPLVAIYPKEGTLLSDSPYLVLKASWVDAAKQAAAKDFLTYLRQPAAQKRFTDAAFRTFDGKPGPVINPDNGLLPQQHLTVISPPSPTVLDAISKSWTQLRKRARVLMVIDVSGSMADAVPAAGTSKLELAKSAALTAVGQLTGDDQLGLWTFSTPQQTGGDPWIDLVPIGPVRTVLPAYKTKVKALEASGGTALYATTRAAYQELQRSFDPTKINAVVLLTDGKNEYPADNNLGSLLTSIHSEDTTTSVRVFPVGYGAQADLTVLSKIGSASRATAYDASDPATIDKVLTNVLSNF